MHAPAKADEARRPFSYPARTLPPLNPCPSCGDSYRAIVCPICKIPIGPTLAGDEKTDEPQDPKKPKYARLFYI